MESVISTYYAQIYKFCYWKTHGSEEAADITQDAFLRFIEAAQTYDDVENPRALLYTIANHLCLNWLKKAHPESIDDSCKEPVTGDFADGTIQKISLSTAIAALSDRQQEILLLRYGQDLKVAEIAEILNLSRFQVMYRIRGALKELKKRLKGGLP